MEFLLSRWHSKRDINMDSVHGGYLSILSKLLTASREGLFIQLHCAEEIRNSSENAETTYPLHSDLIVKVNIGYEDVCFDSTAGVKQGFTMTPLLFAIYFQAANEVLSAALPVSSSLKFRTEKDFCSLAKLLRVLLL